MRDTRVKLVVMLALLVGVLGGPRVAVGMGSSGCPNEASPGFRTYLPECRAYEMVTPPYKEGFPINGDAVSAEGSQLLVESLGNFLTPEGRLPEGTGILGHFYRIARTEAGWESAPLDAPSSRFPEFAVLSMSPDFASSLWLASVPGQSSADVYLDPPSGPLTHVGPGAPPGVAELALTYLGASENLSHDLFAVHSPNVGLEENRLWPGDTTFSEVRPSLYEYAGVGNVEPSLVGVSDEQRVAHIPESHLISDCGTVLGSSPNPGRDMYNAISNSGETVFFTAEECSGSPSVNELYARISQERTVAISEPAHPLAQGSGPGPEECDATCAAATHEPGIFVGASEDGSKVFFLTAQPLLNGDEDTKTDLYEAEIEGEGAHARIGKLIQLSHDPNAGQAAEVQGVARVSEDGSHMYFVARGVLTAEPDLSLRAEHQVAVAGEENLYVYERDARYPGGHTSFIGTLSTADKEDWSPRDSRPAQATPDGSFLVFQSTADLTPDQEGRTEAGQVFEYDAENKTLARVSRGRNGYNEDGNSSTYPATIPIQDYELDEPTTRFTHLAVSADGSRVFFSSPAALTVQALNGVVIGDREATPVYALNIYEYHDGQIGLISDGHDVLSANEHATTQLIGTDGTGLDVFFMTADPLVPQDTDTQIDIYDARMEGGFGSPPEPAGCSPGACKGPAGEVPSLLTPASTSALAEVVSAPPGPALPPKQKAVKKKAKKLKRRPSAHKKRNAKKARAGRK